MHVFAIEAHAVFVKGTKQMRPQRLSSILIYASHSNVDRALCGDEMGEKNNLQ